MGRSGAGDGRQGGFECAAWKNAVFVWEECASEKVRVKCGSAVLQVRYKGHMEKSLRAFYQG